MLILLKVLNLCAMVLAIPQGYNYQTPGFSNFVANQLPPYYNPAQFYGPPLYNPPPSQSPPHLPPLNPSPLPVLHPSQPLPQQPAIITKDVYVHTSPEEPQEHVPSAINAGPPRKHYRIIFIRTPTPTQKQTLNILQAPTEEKTLIYVLSKKTDGADIETVVQQAPATSHKPEVFFIKYKTDEEAALAQKQIQDQYNAIGGSTQVHDEGISPVTSVIGSAGDVGGTVGAVGPVGVIGAVGTVSTVGVIGDGLTGTIAAEDGKYLPPTS